MLIRNAISRILGNLRCCLAVLACLLLVMADGCDDGPSTYTVKGSVSYQGKPVTGGLINFKPARGQPLGGGIKADGSYEFQLPAGEYLVRIDTPPEIPEGWKEGDPHPELGPREVPAKYARFRTSGLTAMVQPSGEPLQIDYSLE